MYDTLVAVTPEVNGNLSSDAISHLAVKIVFARGTTLSTSSFFDFRPNPVVTGVSPTAHLIR
jgi:hypothetical protein